MLTSPIDCEYVIVGSGAGGGTLAARLAEAGRSVVVLEAGDDPCESSGGDAVQADTNRLPADYHVPAFHAFCSENDALSWNFFVRHYEDDDMQRRDSKYVSEYNGRPVNGIFYPRAGTLGGCTAHNAMIFVYPHDVDWHYIAQTTGDSSWEPENMRRYFEKLENCRYRPLERLLAKIGINPTRHGWKGWLPTEQSIPLTALRNQSLIETIADSAFRAFAEDGHQLTRLRWALESGLDPNDWRLTRDNSVGLRFTPLTTRNHERAGSRERLLDVAKRFPDRLRIVLHALASKVILDSNNRAVGVEYLNGERLYRAHAHPSDRPGELRFVRASREVILAGGAFNTPQLLMLSGIGPPEVLERHGILVRVPLPGVGRNLQDRYEISIVNRMTQPWQAYDGADFTTADRQFLEWQNKRSGIYASNGSVLTLFRHSPDSGGVPDLFCMSLLARFNGYYPGYSSRFAKDLNYLTWVVLKAHTRNHAGAVTLRSADPCDTPLIDFNFFEQGGKEDLDAVVDGVRFVRRLTKPLQDQGLILEEELPGSQVESDDDLRDFIRANAWGHHASCTCPIAPRGQGGVLTSDFRVYGTEGLRVADASVFPRIPGFFIASAIYMIAEKAAETILAQRSVK